MLALLLLSTAAVLLLLLLLSWCSKHSYASSRYHCQASSQKPAAQL
jgi:hypothetical protein